MSSSFLSKRTDQKRIIGALLVSEQTERVLVIELERRKRLFESQGKLSMLNALSLTQNVQATDPKEKVFSALFFAAMPQSSSMGPRLCKPNYEQTTTALYTDVARAFLETYGLGVLSLAGVQRAGGNPSLPFWVPDLQLPLPAQPKGINITTSAQGARLTGKNELHQSNGNPPKRFFRTNPRGELVVTAVMRDAVTELSQPGLNDAGPALANLEFWVHLVCELGLPMHERQQVLWRTLIEDRATDETNTQAAHSVTSETFRDWLIFICYTAVFNLRDYSQECVRNFASPEIHSAAMPAILAEDGHYVRSNIAKARALFAALNLSIAPDEVLPRWARTLFDGEDLSNEDMSEDSDMWEVWEEMAPRAEAFGNILRNTDTTRRLMRTGSNNVFGAAPGMAQVGDRICVVEGANVPYLLRTMENGRYTLIGEAYVYRLNISRFLMQQKRIRASSKYILFRAA